MRVTCLGHASVLIEVSGRAVLIDPVFRDRFAEGMLAPCPARRITLARLPKVDVVVLTDALPDHLDIPSLALLPRDCLVVCAQDQRILYVLERLGFKKVRPTPASSMIRSADGFELGTTPSARKATEFGVLIKDRSGTFWDPVTTQLSPAIIDLVRTQFGPVHLLFAGYAWPDYTWFGIQRQGFPGQFLRSAVAMAQRVAPALVVPASAGVRFAEPFDWTNAFLFPISDGRFRSELQRVVPGQACAEERPGDVFEVSRGAVTRQAGASSVVAMIEDDTHRITYDPTAPVPPLTDPNCDRYTPEVLEAQVEGCLSELSSFVRSAYETDPVLLEHRRVAGSYGLGVVYPDGRERCLRVQFGRAAPAIELGEGTVRGAINTLRVAASVLTARARCERSYPYPGGLTRSTVVSPAALVDGQVAVQPREPPDLLMHYLRVRPPGRDVYAKRMLDAQLAPVLAQGGAPCG